MAKRRMHKKSRGGCRQCKARRVKCDENRPMCQTCRRHGDKCDFTAMRLLCRYGTPPVKPEASSSSSSNMPTHPSSSTGTHRYSSLCNYMPPSPPSPPSLFDSIGDTAAQASRPLELRLLHHYMTLPSLIQGPQPQHTHTSLAMNSLVHHALTSPVLMDALLGVSALSLRSLHPQDPLYVYASHKYALAAIRECSRQICTGVNASNARALFLASLLIAFYGFASRQCEDIVEDAGGSGGGGGDGGGEMQSLQWFRLFQGVKAVKEAGRPWIQGYGGPLSLIFNSLPESFTKSSVQGDHFFGFLLEGVGRGEGEDGESRAAYEDAVAYLSYVRADAKLRGLLGFPVAVSTRFVDLLDGRDPTALAIVGNWLGLMRMSRLSRFLKGARERELEEIMHALPQEWWPKMSWAMSVPAADVALIG